MPRSRALAVTPMRGKPAGVTERLLETSSEEKHHEGEERFASRSDVGAYGGDVCIEQHCVAPCGTGDACPTGEVCATRDSRPTTYAPDVRTMGHAGSGGSGGRDAHEKGAPMEPLPMSGVLT